MLVSCRRYIEVVAYSLSIFMLIGSAYGVPRGAVKLSAGSIFVASTGSGTYTCGKPSGKWVPGTLHGAQKDYFLPYSVEIKNSKSDIPKAPAAKKKKLQARVKLLSTKLNPGVAACKSSRPVATPTPEANFDSSGNVTSTGKTNFGIPSYLSANIFIGRTVFNQTCGCHGEKVDYTFPALRQRTSQAPMFFNLSQLPDDDLAQITAYLNRYNQ